MTLRMTMLCKLSERGRVARVKTRRVKKKIRVGEGEPPSGPSLRGDEKPTIVICGMLAGQEKRDWDACEDVGYGVEFPGGKPSGVW